MANKVLMIKRANPIVFKVQRTEGDDIVIYEDKKQVDMVIAEYFQNVYKRPTHMVRGLGVDFNVDSDDEMVVQQEAMHNDNTHKIIFTADEVQAALKECNFDKGLGPDGFDGNVLKTNDELKSKIITEVVSALNNGEIPEYLREGRLIPL